MGCRGGWSISREPLTFFLFSYKRAELRWRGVESETFSFLTTSRGGCSVVEIVRRSAARRSSSLECGKQENEITTWKLLLFFHQLTALSCKVKRKNNVSFNAQFLHSTSSVYFYRTRLLLIVAPSTFAFCVETWITPHLFCYVCNGVCAVFILSGNACLIFH